MAQIVSSSHDFCPGLPDSDPDPARAGSENPAQKNFAGWRSRTVNKDCQDRTDSHYLEIPVYSTTAVLRAELEYCQQTMNADLYWSMRVVLWSSVH
jgi:hypothetical protein